jgi:DNA-binding transcriptional LysR family regulator
VRSHGRGVRVGRLTLGALVDRVEATTIKSKVSFHQQSGDSPSKEDPMDKSSRLEMLVRVVDQGSLVAAGRSLGLTPSAVSRGLSDLERTLGATLLLRSTRRIQLTEDGARVYERALDILSRMQELEAGVARDARSVSGTLRVGLPVPIGRYVIWPRLALLLDRHPELRLDFKPIQDPKAMQSENLDVLLTTGEPPPSRLVAHRLALGRPGIYASPQYVRRFGEPQSPDQLTEHRCLVFHGPWMQTPADQWDFERGGQAASVRVKARVVTPDREGLIVAALSGAGVIRMACFDPALVQDGRLRRLLADWECTSGFNVYALHRKSTSLAPRIQAFMSFVRESFKALDREEMTLLRV